MNDYTMIEKIKILIDIIVSSPLFLSCSMLGIAVLIFLILCVKRDEKISKWVFVIVFLCITLILLTGYNSLIFSLVDNLFDDIFMALYFPNLTVYVIILSISNAFLIYSIFSRKMKKSLKILNITNAFIIDVFLVLVIDTVSKNNINVYNELTVYSNSNLLILLELSSALFTSWILVRLLIRAHYKLKKYDEKEYPNMPQIIFDDI